MALILILTNKSHGAALSDYHYEVSIGDGTIAGSKTLAFGKLTGHLRDAGWKALVRRLLEEAVDVDPRR